MTKNIEPIILLPFSVLSAEERLPALSRLSRAERFRLVQALVQNLAIAPTTHYPPTISKPS